MQKIIIVICLVATSVCSAQSVIQINLEDWKEKGSSLPFTINRVEDNRAQPQRIGTIEFKNDKTATIEFESNSEAMIQTFLNTQFSQENEMALTLEIVKMDIENLPVKRKNVSTFIFACNFYKAGTNEPIYKFNARNSVGNRRGLKLAMTNYVGRAITSAVLNFKKSYLKHPEWQKDIAVSPEVKMKKKIISNNFLGGDTIALDGRYKLQPSDFAASVADEETEDAFSTMVITYDIAADDEAKEIALNIYPKAFFLRSRSWTKGAAANNNWLAHQQLLFDLASHHALLFKKKLETFDFSAGFYRAEVNKIYNEMTEAYFDEMDMLQEQTKFGSNAAKESEWRKKVDGYLGK